MFEGPLSQLIIWLERYYRNENFDKFAWIQDPFNTSAPSEFTSADEENVIDLSCDNSFKARFGSTELTEFWILIPFSTSYLCEAGFSAVAIITSKYRAKINVEKEMRVAVSNLIPRFETMCSDLQPHPSH
jgi:hypothetical protein